MNRQYEKIIQQLLYSEPKYCRIFQVDSQSIENQIIIKNTNNRKLRNTNKNNILFTAVDYILPLKND